jgi:hypothetical protein
MQLPDPRWQQRVQSGERDCAAQGSRNKVLRLSCTVQLRTDNLDAEFTVSIGDQDSMCVKFVRAGPNLAILPSGASGGGKVLTGSRPIAYIGA